MHVLKLYYHFLFSLFSALLSFGLNISGIIQVINSVEYKFLHIKSLLVIWTVNVLSISYAKSIHLRFSDSWWWKLLVLPILYTYSFAELFNWENLVCSHFWVECMSCETWNQSIKDTIACVVSIGLYVIDSILQCDFFSSIIYAFKLHDSWFRGIEISFEWSYCMTVVSLLSSWHEMSRCLWVSSLETLTRHHSSNRVT